MANVKSLIFDLFETLVPNTSDRWIRIFEVIVVKQSLNIDPLNLWAEWKRRELIFRKKRAYIDESEKELLFESYKEVWLSCFRMTYFHFNCLANAERSVDLVIQELKKTPLYPEVKNVISKLQKKWHTGVLSNADDAYLFPILERNKLIFPIVKTSEQLRLYKPHPKVFKYLLDEINLKPEECVFIGDNKFDDILGAGRIGIKTVWVNRFNEPLKNFPIQPTYIVSNISELENILKDL